MLNNLQPTIDHLSEKNIRLELCISVFIYSSTQLFTAALILIYKENVKF